MSILKEPHFEGSPNFWCLYEDVLVPGIHSHHAQKSGGIVNLTSRLGQLKRTFPTPTCASSFYSPIGVSMGG
jgi:hypothetical protein